MKKKVKTHFAYIRFSIIVQKLLTVCKINFRCSDYGHDHYYCCHATGYSSVEDNETLKKNIARNRLNFLLLLRTKVNQEENGTPNFQYEENRPSASGPTVVKSVCFGTFSKLGTTLTVPQKERSNAYHARGSSSVSLSSEVQPLINFLKYRYIFIFFHYCRA